MSYAEEEMSRHTSKNTKAWFQDNQINVMNWPAPDLNPFKNLWKVVKRAVNGKRCKNFGRQSQLNDADVQLTQCFAVAKLLLLIRASLPNIDF